MKYVVILISGLLLHGATFALTFQFIGVRKD